MHKHGRSSAGSKTRNVSRWDLPESQRKSMSLHDLTESPIDASLGNAAFHQNPSLLTLDSIPKSRDSGLSRSASRLSLVSVEPGVQEKPRSPKKSDLKAKIRDLEKILRENKKMLREKDEIISEQKLMYKTLFFEHQALQLKFAEYQNHVDRLRVEMYSKKSPPKNFFSQHHRSQTSDGIATSVAVETRAPPSEISQSEDMMESSDMSTVTITAHSSSSGDESQDKNVCSAPSSTADHPLISAPSSVADNPPISAPSSLADQAPKSAPSSLTSQPRSSAPSSLRSIPPTQLLPSNGCHELLRMESPAFPRIQQLSMETGGCRDAVVSPAPSSRWTLDKSFQLVSDSEQGEDSPQLQSMDTQDTMLLKSQSEETLKASEDNDDVFSGGLAFLPGSFQDSSTPLLVSKLPEESPDHKVQRWRDAHGLVHKASGLVQKAPGLSWKLCQKRPQNLSLSTSPMLQRLRSPQNLSLLSPRPFHRPASVPSLVSPPCTVPFRPPVVPPLDLSALISETSQSAGEERERIRNNRSKENHNRVQGAVDPRQLDKMLRRAERNMLLSRAVVSNLASRYQSE